MKMFTEKFNDKTRRNAMANPEGADGAYGFTC